MGHNLCQGKKIKCSISRTKHRLFISNVPRNWMEENMTKAMSEVGPGVIRVQVVKVTPIPSHVHVMSANVLISWDANASPFCSLHNHPSLLFQDPQNSSLNRGYAFIEYYNGACANYSRKKMSSPNFKLDDHAPTVSWAIRRTADFDSNSQVSVNLISVLSLLVLVYLICLCFLS